MRKDDVRRYCLDCSEKTGRLVQRICPALEKKRAAKTDRRKVKAKTKRERAKKRAKRWPAILRDHFEEMKKLKCWKDDVKHATLKIRRGPGGGHCKYSGEVVVSVSATPERVQKNPAAAANSLSTLMHELAHAATTGDGHGDAWRSRYSEAVRELLGQVDILPTTRHRYSMDPKVRVAFAEAIKSGNYDLGEVEPTPRRTRRAPDLPPGMVRFNISDWAWVECNFDNTEHEGLSKEAWAALRSATSRKAGKGRTNIVTATYAIAKEIANEMRDAPSMEWAALDRCATAIEKKIAEAKKCTASS